MAEEKEAVPVVEKPAKASNVGLLIMIMAITLISNGAFAGVNWYLINKAVASAQPAKEATPEDEAKKAEEEMAEAVENGGVVALEPFVVNLADTDAARYLRIKVTLMVDDKAKVAEIKENEALTMKVRDVILQTLTRKTSQDLINEEGKNKLRHEIQEQVEHYFKEPKLMDVMFTEFVIQL